MQLAMIDIDELQLETVSPDYTNNLIQTIMMWYKSWVRHHEWDAPNIQQLFSRDDVYHESLFDPVACTICDREGLIYEDALSRAYEIIDNELGIISIALHRDVCKILNQSNMFYADGYETIADEDDEVIYWQNTNYRNQMIQEVW